MTLAVLRTFTAQVFTATTSAAVVWSPAVSVSGPPKVLVVTAPHLSFFLLVVVGFVAAEPLQLHLLVVDVGVACNKMSKVPVFKMFQT